MIEMEYADGGWVAEFLFIIIIYLLCGNSINWLSAGYYLFIWVVWPLDPFMLILYFHKKTDSADETVDCEQFYIFPQITGMKGG